MRPLKVIFLILLCISLGSCEKSTESDVTQPVEPIWERVASVEGFNATSLKIINGELYFAGRTSTGNCIYRTSDGESWGTVSTALRDSFPNGVAAIAGYEGGIIAVGYYYSPLNKISPDGSIEQISPNLWIFSTDMDVYNSEIYIGAYNSEALTRIDINGGLHRLKLRAYDNNCGETYSDTNYMHVAILKKNEWHGENLLFAGLSGFNHFFCPVDTSGLICFTREGIDTWEEWYGLRDFIISGDTIYAGGIGVLKYYYNNKWEILGDSLPKTNGRVSFINAITKADNRLFVAVNKGGIYEYTKEGWLLFGDGLPQAEAGDNIDELARLIYYKGYLFAAYGARNYGVVEKMGLWRYKL